MTDIALIGYGQMGHRLEALAPQQNCRVVSRFDPGIEQYNLDITPKNLNGAKVALDFSLGKAVAANSLNLAKAGVNIVIGVTGWQQQQQQVQQLCTDYNLGIVTGSNFSVGMNLFYLLAQKAAGLFNLAPQYDTYLHEAHHSKKADSPSGTAYTLGNMLLYGLDSKTELLTGNPAGKIQPQQLHISSTRCGNIPGTHTIGFDSAADTITLTHTARSRDGFALGALAAARWLDGKTGYYDFTTIFEEILNG